METMGSCVETVGSCGKLRLETEVSVSGPEHGRQEDKIQSRQLPDKIGTLLAGPGCPGLEKLDRSQRH